MFFRSAREDIEQACLDGRLNCRPDGHGLVPPFELRWTRAYVQELFTLLKMTLAPKPHLAGPLPERYEVDANFGRIVQFVTLTSNFDTSIQAGGTSSVERYLNPLAKWRDNLGDWYHTVTPWLIIFAVGAFVFRVFRWDKVRPNALSLVIAIFMLYTSMRIAALAYPAVFFGHFDNRLVYSTHSLLLLTALLAIADAALAMRAVATKNKDINPGSADSRAGFVRADVNGKVYEAK
jgi:hypothetical protein